MEKAYWLGRKRASVKLAQDAEGSEARLVHYDMAGRYSVKAVMADARGRDLADILPPAIKPGGTSSVLKATDNA